MGLFDDFAELVGGGVFAGSHVGEEIKFGIATHDNEAGEGFVRLFGLWVGHHGESITTGKNDITSRMRNASNHSVGSAILDHFASGIEAGSGDGFDFGPGV